MPKRIRSRSRSSVKRYRRAAPTRMRTIRRNIARSRITRTNAHAFTRWSLPSVYNSITQQGNVNYDNNMIYDTSQGTIRTNALVAGATQTAMSLQFAIGDIANFAEFNNLYDQYKICGVKVSIKMVNSPDTAYVLDGTVVNSRTNFYPTLWYVRDYDDTNTLLLSEIRQYKGARHVVLRPNKEVSIYIKPRILRQIFNSTTGAGYEIAIPKYMDLATPAIPHLGIKTVFDFEGQPLASAATGDARANQWVFKLNFKYYFMCKSVR